MRAVLFDGADAIVLHRHSGYTNNQISRVAFPRERHMSQCPQHPNYHREFIVVSRSCMIPCFGCIYGCPCAVRVHHECHVSHLSSVCHGLRSRRGESPCRRQRHFCYQRPPRSSHFSTSFDTVSSFFHLTDSPGTFGCILT